MWWVWVVALIPMAIYVRGVIKILRLSEHKWERINGRDWKCTMCGREYECRYVPSFWLYGMWLGGEYEGYPPPLGCKK